MIIIITILNLVCFSLWQRDEADGEIYLHRCLRVEEFDADKNYGLQLHVRTCQKSVNKSWKMKNIPNVSRTSVIDLQMHDGLVTLSAMTSRIRRNWIDTLRRRISFRDSAESIQYDQTEGKNKCRESISGEFHKNISGKRGLFLDKTINTIFKTIKGVIFITIKHIL